MSTTATSKRIKKTVSHTASEDAVRSIASKHGVKVLSHVHKTSVQADDPASFENFCNDLAAISPISVEDAETGGDDGDPANNLDVENPVA